MSEDIFTLSAQVQAVIERAKENAIMLRDGSFRDNAMQVIVELDSRLKQAQQREQAAYERGKAEGREAERERIVPLLNARKQTAAVSETRAQQNNKPHIALVYHNEVEVWDEAINIVNQVK